MGKAGKIFKGAGFLALASMAAKLIGALYRIPLTNIIGAEGIGLYQMVFPLYTVLLTISSGGLPTAISKVVSKMFATGDEAGARKVLKVSLLSLSLLGGIASLFIILGRHRIAYIQGNPKAAVAYLGIAPSLIFVAVISCFRGYYQGSQNMFPSAMSQLTEQVSKLTVGLLLARILSPAGVEFAVLGALLGVSASELIAMAGLLVQFVFTNRNYKKRSYVSLNRLSLSFEAASELTGDFKTYSTGAILKNVYRVAIPVTLGSLVLPITQVIDSILVINMLVGYGFTRLDATSMFGIINGPIGSLVNMPIVITLSISIALLPKLSGILARGEEGAERLTGQSLKYSLLIGIPCAILLAVFSKDILTLLYRRGLTPMQRELGANLLKIASVSVLYVSLIQVSTAVLQAYDLSHKPAVNLLVGACCKVIFTLLLLTKFNVAGAVAATVICYFVTCFLDIRCLRKCIRPEMKLWEMTGAPLISGAGLAATGILLSRLFKAFLPARTAFIAALVIAALVYIVLIFLTRGIRKEEISTLPVVGEFLKKLAAHRARKREKKAAKTAAKQSASSEKKRGKPGRRASEKGKDET